jgi:hypothetical protein
LSDLPSMMKVIVLILTPPLKRRYFNVSLLYGSSFTPCTDAGAPRRCASGICSLHWNELLLCVAM